MLEDSSRVRMLVLLIVLIIAEGGLKSLLKSKFPRIFVVLVSIVSFL